jgi:hypothetical protein
MSVKGIEALSLADLEALLASKREGRADELVKELVGPLADRIVEAKPVAKSKSSDWVGSSETFSYTNDAGAEYSVKVVITAKNDVAKGL